MDDPHLELHEKTLELIQHVHKKNIETLKAMSDQNIETIKDMVEHNKESFAKIGATVSALAEAASMLSDAQGELARRIDDLILSLERSPKVGFKTGADE